MNYRHAFHAGNHADVLKHAVLLWCLAYLKTKPAPFAVLDTHAGAGWYDLSGAEAERSPEWREGAARIFDWTDAPPLIGAYRDALRRANRDGALKLYPGSPLLIRSALRADDRLIACERHPDDAAALKTRFRGDRQVQVHRRDGWEALQALLPPRERRALVLIDPPYEEEGELVRGARALAAALARFPTGVFLWWRPMKLEYALDAVDAEARQRTLALAPAPELMRVDLAVAAPAPGAKLSASSLLLANAPYELENTLRADMPALAQRLAQAAGASWRVDRV